MSPDEKKVIRDCLEEVLNSMHRTAAERDLQKDIVARIKEETELTPKVFRRMARVAFKANFSEEAAFNDEFEATYESVLADA